MLISGYVEAAVLGESCIAAPPGSWKASGCRVRGFDSFFVVQGVDLSDPAAEERASSRGQVLREFVGAEAPKEAQLAVAAGAVQLFREAHSQKGCGFIGTIYP